MAVPQIDRKVWKNLGKLQEDFSIALNHIVLGSGKGKLGSTLPRTNTAPTLCTWFFFVQDSVQAL